MRKEPTVCSPIGSIKLGILCRQLGIHSRGIKHTLRSIRHKTFHLSKYFAAAKHWLARSVFMWLVLRRKIIPITKILLGFDCTSRDRTFSTALHPFQSVNPNPRLHDIAPLWYQILKPRFLYSQILTQNLQKQEFWGVLSCSTTMRDADS